MAFEATRVTYVPNGTSRQSFLVVPKLSKIKADLIL